MMEELFKKYTQAFDQLDASAITDLYMIPCSISDGDGANVYSNRESLIEKFSLNCSTLKQAGYQHSKFNVLDTTRLGNAAKAVIVGWQVITAGSVFEFRALYICHRINGSWRIFSTHVYPDSFS
jgi:hypothetical protein